ncbi:MAG: hypothetical protein JO340_02290 [Acidobacteriaceae bacterium]|nr:hypothetical protein [Acidobacteriaceae bacterium]
MRSKLADEMGWARLGNGELLDNHWPIVRDHVPAIDQAIEKAQPGEAKPVFCGTFLARKFK